MGLVVLRARRLVPSRRRMTTTPGQLGDLTAADLHVRLYFERHVESYAERHIRLYTDTVARYHGGDPIAPAFRRIAGRRGLMIGRVAAARKLLTLVFYGLRDGEIRCLADRETS